MKRTCNECHGSGETCYFKGESRFVLSRDECPACAGLGFVEVEGSVEGSVDDSTEEDIEHQPPAGRTSDDHRQVL